MTIDSISKLETGLDSRFIRHVGNRSSISNQSAGFFVSTWRSTGFPAQGAIPTTAAAVTNATTGAIAHVNATGSEDSYIGGLEISSTLAGTTIEIHDRLVAIGGFNGTLTTAQLGFDLSTFTGSNNIAERIGDTNYSDVLWWLEIYADVGGTGVTCTFTITYNDGTTGTLVVPTFGNTVRRAGTMFPLNSLIPAVNSGKYIRGFTQLVLGGTAGTATGTAGNFGVTATRYRCGGYTPLANRNFKLGWTDIALPQVYNSSALFTIINTPAATTGVTNYFTKIVYG